MSTRRTALHRLPDGDWGWFTYSGDTTLHLLRLGERSAEEACTLAGQLMARDFFPGDAGQRAWAESWLRNGRPTWRHELEQEAT